MLTGCVWFRGNYMARSAAAGLLRNLCKCPEMAPDCWNVFEPISRPFDSTDAVTAAMVPEGSSGSTVFFRRKRNPKLWMALRSTLCPWQWTTPHNSLSVHFESEWSDEELLTRYLAEFVSPKWPDYASVPLWSEDKDRYRELERTYCASEFIHEISNRKIAAPFGPFGCLGDVQWFNYFGKVYVEAIGRERLLSADWERVEVAGDGLACFATRAIDDPHSRERRDRIAASLGEFVWAPRRRENEVRVPEFDFSEQTLALSSLTG